MTVRVRDTARSFGAATVSALTLEQGLAIEPVVLSPAPGGNGALTYRAEDADDNRTAAAAAALTFAVTVEATATVPRRAIVKPRWPRWGRRPWRARSTTSARGSAARSLVASGASVPVAGR